MKRKFAVFDIDGTLFRSHLFWEVALELARTKKLHPKINDSALKLYSDWQKRVHDRAFEDFDKTTISAIDELTTEMDPIAYDKALKLVMPRIIDHTYMYTKKLLDGLNNKGYFTIAISGSRIEEVEIFAKHHGFDEWIGQKFERSTDGKRYTGNKQKTHFDKHLILQKLIDKHNLTIVGSYGVGDTGGDISMLEVVDVPIAFNPNQDLLKHAKQKGWKIVVERKSIAYELEDNDGHFFLA